MNAAEARTKITEVYSTKIAIPLAAVNKCTRELLPMLDALPEADKKNIAARTRTFAEGVATIAASRGYGEESFVPPDTLAALASLSRQPQALEGAFKAFADPTATLASREKTAATVRWEPFDQFTDSMQAVAAALEDAGKKELAEKAHSIARNAGQVRAGIAGGELDTLFRAAVSDMPVEAASAEDAGKIYRTQIATPMEHALKAANALVTELAALPPADKQKLDAMTVDYAKQSTLQDAVTPASVPDALPGLVKNLQALKMAFETVTAEKKTRELTAEEQTAVSNPWKAVNDLRAPVRGLSAMMNALNAHDSASSFRSDNVDKRGRYDQMIALAADVTSGCWEMQKALQPDNSKKIAEAVAAFTAKPVEAPATTLAAPAAIAVTPPEQQRGVG